MVRTPEAAAPQPDAVRHHTDAENFPNGHVTVADSALLRQRYMRAGYREILPGVFDDGESLRAAARGVE